MISKNTRSSLLLMQRAGPRRKSKIFWICYYWEQEVHFKCGVALFMEKSSRRTKVHKLVCLKLSGVNWAMLRSSNSRGISIVNGHRYILDAAKLFNVRWSIQMDILTFSSSPNCIRSDDPCKWTSWHLQCRQTERRPPFPRPLPRRRYWHLAELHGRLNPSSSESISIRNQLNVRTMGSMNLGVTGSEWNYNSIGADIKAHWIENWMMKKGERLQDGDRGKSGAKRA